MNITFDDRFGKINYNNNELKFTSGNHYINISALGFENIYNLWTKLDFARDETAKLFGIYRSSVEFYVDSNVDDTHSELYIHPWIALLLIRELVTDKKYQIIEMIQRLIKYPIQMRGYLILLKSTKHKKEVYKFAYRSKPVKKSDIIYFKQINTKIIISIQTSSPSVNDLYKFIKSIGVNTINDNKVINKYFIIDSCQYDFCQKIITFIMDNTKTEIEREIEIEKITKV